jgi:cell division protein FtsI/penicillin-binding protein 2
MIDTLRRRLAVVALILVILTGLITYRLVTLQFVVDADYFAQLAHSEYTTTREVRPPRGEVFDRHGVLLATNTLEYEIGISPVLIYDRQGTAEKLAAATGLSAEDLLEQMSSPAPYLLIMRPASAAVGQMVLAQNLTGVSVTPIPRRFYPHGTLAAHVLGFVGYDGKGYYGIEGFYNKQLTGQVEYGDESRIPFYAQRGESVRPSTDLVLTLDTEIQYLAEEALARALAGTGAQSGTILVMDPQTGEVLAMASLPAYNPNLFYEEDKARIVNPAVSQQYEPGSVFKILTMAVALETGTVLPNSTYTDNGVIEVGGREIYNWDRQAHGVTSMTDLLAKSLNVGAATLSLTMGPTRFYSGLDVFGLGEITGVDLEGEAPGSYKKPGSSEWHESDLATNAFGQGVAMTPIQMLVAVGAVANRGLMMQPHVVYQRIEPDGSVQTAQPTALGRAISADTARELTEMLAAGLEREASGALVPGYRIAGKTGTAQIPIPGGYDPEQTIASFVGFGPVDDPRFLVLVKLDKPTSSPWGSLTAAPVFGEFVQRLVVVMEIPPDDVRGQLAASD